MHKSPLRSRKTIPLRSVPQRTTLPTAELVSHLDNWLLDGEIRQHSASVRSTRRLLLSKFDWFLRSQNHARCGTPELRQFLAYATRGHTKKGGRRGNPHLTQPLSPRTVKDYHAHLRTFFRWLVAEGCLDSSPMEAIPAPISRADQVRPFTETQVRALLTAARQSDHPRRDEAIMLFLADIGVRASELCGLRQSDVNMQERYAVVLGKGNKRRTVYFGLYTVKAITTYTRGVERGGALTRWGLREIVERAGKVAAIETARCSAHTFRHTMAVTFLRNGGQVFALRELLGHTDLKMTNHYVMMAQADIASQHRRFSPVDHIQKR